MEDALDAAGLLLSVGATSMQRRSSRCQAAAETRRAAEAVDQQLPFGAGAARTGAGAGAGLTVGRRGKKTIPALQARSEALSDGSEADAEDDEPSWAQASPLSSRSATQRKTPKSAGKAGRRPVARQRTSRFMGVGASNRAGQWQARILVHGKVTHLGYYVAEEDAARAYDRVSLAMYGNAPTNFPASQYSAAEIARLQSLDRASLQQALGVKPMQKSSRFRGVSRKKGRWEAKVMVRRKWAYRELFNSEEAAARAYDAAVWQLKPYEVAKAYVNFRDECPVVPPPSQKAAKAAPSSKAPAAAGSSGQRLPALPSVRTAAAAPPGRQGGLARAETAPAAALARASSSDHSLSGGASGVSDASRASSMTRVSAFNLAFMSGMSGSGSFTAGSYGGGAASAGAASYAGAAAPTPFAGGYGGGGGAASMPYSSGAAGGGSAGAGAGGSVSFGTTAQFGASGGSAPPSPSGRQPGFGGDGGRPSPPPLPALSLGWPSAPITVGIAPANSPHAQPEFVPQVHSAGSMVAGPPPAGDWRSTPPPGTPMSVDTSGRAGGDLSPAYQSVTLQQDGGPPGGVASDAAGMLGQTQAWSRDTQRPTTPQMPQLPRIPLRAASTPHPLQLPGGGLQPPMRGGSFSGAAGGGKPRPGSPIWRMQTPVQMQQQPQPMTLQVPSPGHPAASTSPWLSHSPGGESPSPPAFRPLRLPSAPAGGGLMGMRSASTGALATSLGQTWVPSSQMSTLPRSASFAGNPQAPLRMTPHGMPNGLAHSLSADYCQDMLPELLAQQAFKQEPQESPLRMGSVHIGGEELMFAGGASEFEGMFDD